MPEVFIFASMCFVRGLSLISYIDTELERVHASYTEWLIIRFGHGTSMPDIFFISLKYFSISICF